MQLQNTKYTYLLNDYALEKASNYIIVNTSNPHNLEKEISIDIIIPMSYVLCLYSI